MKKLISTFKNIWEIKELRDKLLFTFGLVLVYRFASFIPLPAIDIFQVGNILERYKQAGGSDQATGLLGLLSSFTGGAFSRASIMALGVMPYISASIVVQLMGLAVPYLQKLQKEGESGRKTINQITRWLTILICLVQAPTYLVSITQGLIPYSSAEYASAYLIHPEYNWFWFWVPSVVILVAGTIFTMWLGEKITDKGIGNGISILIMVGILADFPRATIVEFDTQSTPVLFLIEAVIWLVVLALCIVLVTAVRKVPVQYVAHIQRGGARAARTSVNAARNFIPLKVNAAGVMPIIFAQALMFVPGLLAGSGNADGEKSTIQLFFSSFNDMFSWQYNVLFALLIIIFTYFYTAITIPVNQMADDLKRNGGLIPKVKPGEDTANFLDDILSKITLPGAIFLAFVAIMPAFVKDNITATQQFARFFGGTSLIIMVGVILDTVQQINIYLLNHHYDGLMKSKLSRNPSSI